MTGSKTLSRPPLISPQEFKDPISKTPGKVLSTLQILNQTLFTSLHDSLVVPFENRTSEPAEPIHPGFGRLYSPRKGDPRDSTFRIDRQEAIALAFQIAGDRNRYRAHWTHTRDRKIEAKTIGQTSPPVIVPDIARSGSGLRYRFNVGPPIRPGFGIDQSRPDAINRCRYLPCRGQEKAWHNPERESKSL